MRVQNQKRSLIQLLALSLFLSSKAFASPNISAVTQLPNNLKIEGSGFGVKTTAAPLKFTNFDSDSVGSVPVGWDAPESDDCLVKNMVKHSGSNSLDSSVTDRTTDFFPRISWDMGKTIPLNGYLYLSAWMYLDKTSSTATGWNWKGPLITSSNSPYYWVSGSTTHSAIGFAGFYDEPGLRWFNTAGTIQYSAGNNAAYNYCTSGNSWASDAFTFGGWQRVEWIFKASSTAGASDGSITVNRIGKTASALASKGCVTHGDTSELWRYVSFPQGITNITGGTLNLKMNFDDVYIDNSLARVEICDTSTWANRTHCEIQPPTAWAADGITVNYNPGSFTVGQNAFVYVVDSNGNVNSNGTAFTIKSASSTPVIPAPTNLTRIN